MMTNINDEYSDVSKIYNYLADFSPHIYETIDKYNNFYQFLKTDFFEPISPIQYNNMCCNIHERNFNPNQCNDVIVTCNEKNSKLKQKHKLEPKYAHTLMDDIFYINTDSIHILDNKICFENIGSLKNINFAACWNTNGRADSYVQKKNLNKWDVQFPPIYYKIDNNGYHFTIDMFNNDFVIVKSLL